MPSRTLPLLQLRGATRDHLFLAGPRQPQGGAVETVHRRQVRPLPDGQDAGFDIVEAQESAGDV